MSVARPLHPEDRGAEAPDQHTRLLTLAERLLIVTEVPDDVDDLKRAYEEQGWQLYRLAKHLEGLERRIKVLERRERQRGTS